MSRLRPWLLLAALAALLMVAALLSSPRGLDAGLEGTLALKRLLASFGRDVRTGGSPPPGGTFVLLVDLREPDQDQRLLEWVRSGGRLVLADPGSAMLDLLRIELDRDAPAGRLAPGCLAPEARGVRLIEARGLAGLRPAYNDAGCFRSRDAALLLGRDLGSGRIVLLGDASPLTNEFLRRGDAATLALQMIPAGPVVFGGPLDPAQEAEGRGLWASLPLAGKAAVVQVGLALVAFAVGRGRRLGRPVVEEPITPIPAGELPRAVAQLYRNARAAAYAGGQLRRAMTGRLGRRVGVPGATPQELAAVLARAGAGTEPQLLDALAGPEPVNDDELMALGRALEDVRRRVEDRAAVAAESVPGEPGRDREEAIVQGIDR